MKSWLQRIRGALGIGVTWAVGWAPVGAIVGWITGTAFGYPIATIAMNYAILFGVLGFTGGAMFSTAVHLAEGRRRFEELTMPRFVVWGALGGLALGGLAVALGILGAGFDVLGATIAGAATLLGAGSAAGTLAVARAGELPKSLEGTDGAGPERLTRGRLDA